jgi:hypothetical protein
VSGYLHMKFQGKRVPIYGRTHEMFFFLNLLDFDSSVHKKMFSSEPDVQVRSDSEPEPLFGFRFDDSI